VRYSDEEAGYVTIRPVVRQTFRLDELLDMILSVAGKDVTRVRQILRSGTVVYHFFRYWWAGFDADEVELRDALTRFPDPEPSRSFSPERCARATFEVTGINPHPLLELDRAAASRRRIFRGKSFWDSLLEIAGHEKLTYQGYSYGQRADLYRLELNPENLEQLTQAAKRFAPRKLRPPLRAALSAARIVFACTRETAAQPDVGVTSKRVSSLRSVHRERSPWTEWQQKYLWPFSILHD
jgi:hypothetical protein